MIASYSVEYNFKLSREHFRYQREFSEHEEHFTNDVGCRKFHKG